MGAFDKTIEFIEKSTPEELQKRMEEYGVKFVKNKPECNLIGANGNIFNLVVIARKTLFKANMVNEAEEMIKRIPDEAEDYDHALRIIMEYVEVV